MAYMNVLFEDQDVLHLSRCPSFKSWSILGCVIACGVAAVIYSSDHIVWNLFYFSMSIFIGLSFMDDYEECIFDKKENTVKIKQISFLQKIFQTQSGNRVVTTCLSEVSSLRIKEEILNEAKAYCVSLAMAAGYVIPITEAASLDNRVSHEYIAQKICDFLSVPLGNEDHFSMPDTPDSNISDNSSLSDESFEHVDPSELVDDINQDMIGDSVTDAVIKDMPSHEYDSCSKIDNTQTNIQD